MPLLKCKLCDKIFNSAGGRTCSECLKSLDELYPKVRSYLRDHPDAEFHVDTLAEEMKIDVRKIQALVDMGYLERESHRIIFEDRQKLAGEFQDALQQMKSTNVAKKTTTYGAQRYGKNR